MIKIFDNLDHISHSFYFLAVFIRNTVFIFWLLVASVRLVIDYYFGSCTGTDRFRWLMICLLNPGLNFA